MLRLSRSLSTGPPVRLLVSVRTPDDLYYAGELPGPEVTVAYSRRAPAGDTRPEGRVAAEDVGRLVMAGEGYVCGPAGFVEHASMLLVEAGMEANRIRTERFGPTG
jgi:ferredoxin-NADP reductase